MHVTGARDRTLNGMKVLSLAETALKKCCEAAKEVTLGESQVLDESVSPRRTLSSSPWTMRSLSVFSN